MDFAIYIKRILWIFFIAWVVSTGHGMANPVRKTILLDGFEREYLVYTPSHPTSGKAVGILVCLHGFGRTMNDFFGQYNITSVADSLNLIIVAPQALPEQNKLLNFEAFIIGTAFDNSLVLNSVWGCGLGIHVSFLFSSSNFFDEELNKNVDDLSFINSLIDETQSDYNLQDHNLFVLGTSMGGFMAYQYALKYGKRLSGIISIAGSMGIDIKGMDYSTKIPICDFHSFTDEIVPYIGSKVQNLLMIRITLAKPKADVIDYWTKTNATGSPIKEQIQYYPSTNGITVEKFTYPDPNHEVVHYKINDAPHDYFFNKDNGDCMDHLEEIIRFIQSHLTLITHNTQAISVQQQPFYPNPVNNRIYLSSLNGLVTIFDITGKMILTQPFSNGQADLSTLKTGIYFIHIQAGNAHQIDKLIKR